MDTGSGDKDIETDDEDDEDDDDDDDLREPIVPTEEEEGDNTSGRSGLIPSVNTNTNTDEDDHDEDGGDLITEVKSQEIDNTDDIPSKLNHFYSGYKSMCDLK